MITGAVKRRLVAFVVLTAVGVVYITANYLGIVDKVLGRGFEVTAELPGTGGLYEGGVVTYRGVGIGEIVRMRPTPDGVEVDLRLEEGTELPKGSPMFVHNGSAVGEQYLDFEPASEEGPYAEEGDVFTAGADALPVDEADLIVTMDRFVRSVDTDNLSTFIRELGLTFFNTAEPLQDIIDGSTQLIDAAVANKDETISLLRRGEVFLQTQADNADSIRAFASGLQTVTRTLADSDRNIRTLLEGGPGTITQVRRLLEGLEPTMPVLLSNLITVNQVASVRIDAIEQLLVTYPALIAGGFTGTTDDGYGHVNLQFDQSVQPCTQGYLPRSQWRPGSDVSDGTPFLEARCEAPPPNNMRGSRYAPSYPSSNARVAPYDPATGTVSGAGTDGQNLIVENPGARDIYGEEAWKWMLVGPTLSD